MKGTSTHLLPVRVVYLQLRVLLTGERPVAHHDASGTGLGQDGLTGTAVLHMTSCFLQLLQKLSTVLCKVHKRGLHVVLVVYLHRHVKAKLYSQ